LLFFAPPPSLPQPPLPCWISISSALLLLPARSGQSSLAPALLNQRGLGGRRRNGPSSRFANAAEERGSNNGSSRHRLIEAPRQRRNDGP
jgi:hypothetical protein